MGDPIYLDHQATTPLHSAVHEAMSPPPGGIWGNPHAISHSHGAHAALRLATSIETIADWLGRDPREITLTSGATESCNLTLRGLAPSPSEGIEYHIVTAATEHDAVRNTARDLESKGASVRWAESDKTATIDPAAVEEAIRKQPKARKDGAVRLVSIMGANNETSAMNDIEGIAEVAAKYGYWLHCDATQMPARVLIDDIMEFADLVTISAHKMYGPVGIGALITRLEVQTMLRPIATGGGQQGLRSGTMPVMLAQGLAKAAELCRDEITKHAKTLHRCIGTLKKRLTKLKVPYSYIDPPKALPGAICMQVEGMTSERLTEEVAQDISIGQGSACHGDGEHESVTLEACGIDSHERRSYVRISFGWGNSVKDANTAADAIASAHRRCA